MKLTGGRVAQKPNSKLDVFPEGIVLVAHSTIDENLPLEVHKLELGWYKKRKLKFGIQKSRKGFRLRITAVKVLRPVAR